MNKPKGFSLIELLVVIAIIGLLSTMAVVSLNNARQKARDARRQGDLKSLQTAIEMYKTTQADDVVPQPANWAALGTTLAGLLTSAPTDPGNNSYIYCYDSTTPNTNNGYMLAGHMEQKVTIPGDLDTKPTITGTVACISSSATAPTAWATINCADVSGSPAAGAGNITGANQVAFCLGQNSN